MNNIIVILRYLNEIEGYSNWYKIHRKYFGDTKYVNVLETLKDTLEYLVREKLVSIEKVIGEIDRISITEMGKEYLLKNS